MPLIEGTIGCLECRMYARYPGGDHEIHVGEVVQVSERPGQPLLYVRGEYIRDR